MARNNPLVSIITVVLNNKDTIEDAIKSVLGQTYKNIEYIIVDGGSTDGTVDVIKKYAKYISKWVSEPDNGIYDAMNKGLKLATGDIIGFLNSDDVLNSNDCISAIVKTFEENDVDVVYGNKVYSDKEDLNKIIRYWDAGEYNINNFKKGWMPPHLSFYAKREIYNKYGYYRTDLKIAADYELMFRFLYKHRIKAKHLPKPIAKMRVGGISNKSIKNILISNYEVYKSWRLNGFYISPFIIIRKPLSKIKQFLKRRYYYNECNIHHSR